MYHKLFQDVHENRRIKYNNVADKLKSNLNLNKPSNSISSFNVEIYRENKVKFIEHLRMAELRKKRINKELNKRYREQKALSKQNNSLDVSKR